MATSFKLEGIEKVIRQMNALGSKGPTAARRGLRKWAEGVATIAKDERCPVAMDGGQLRSTIKVEQNGDEITISAGGPAAPYAHEVHEDFAWHKENVGKGFNSIHWTKAGTGPKYLEAPVVEQLPNASPMMLAEMDKVQNGA